MILAEYQDCSQKIGRFDTRCCPSVSAALTFFAIVYYGRMPLPEHPSARPIQNNERSFSGFSKGGDEMANEAIHPEADDSLYLAESVRFLWEATRRVIYGGIDTDHLIALCTIVARLSERRLSRLKSGPRSPECDKAIQQLYNCHQSALDLLAWAKTPTAEPDWSAVGEKLASIGAAPLDFGK